MSPADPADPANPIGDWRQPRLDGKLIALRPLSESDWTELYAVAADPLIWDLHPVSDRWREPVFRAFFDGALASGGAIAIIERASGAIVGSSRWVLSELDPAVTEIGWTFLARRCWRTGMNRELKRMMLAHAFQHVATAEFRVGADNVRSRAAVEGIGGRLLARTQTIVLAGKPVEHVIYQVKREDFATGPLSRTDPAG